VLRRQKCTKKRRGGRKKERNVDSTPWRVAVTERGSVRKKKMGKKPQKMRVGVERDNDKVRKIPHKGWKKETL